MGQATEEFRRVFLPYCIERVEGHGHVVLNRLYKPLGMRTEAHVDYAPHAVRFAALSPTQAELLSHARSQDTDRIHLYADASAPTKSQADWDAYQGRLQILAAMEIG
ncbi:hypothetical protein [uncultured Luteimonas sp.]|uniref:hypothetical protein n=1 Tax=uncultured Luteimonas sp. TaxID=453144 RepID=UPI002628C42B|nr:hypothetical protein [uncultured Luteimonas sp.]